MRKFLILFAPKNEKLSVYVAPALSIIHENGYAGIIVFSVSIFNKLKLEMRYELTSQTNNFKI